MLVFGNYFFYFFISNFIYWISFDFMLYFLFNFYCFKILRFWSLVWQRKTGYIFCLVTKYRFIRTFKITWLLFYFNFLVKYLSKNLQLLQQTRKLPKTNFILYILTIKKHKPLYSLSFLSFQFFFIFFSFLVYFLSSHERNKNFPPINQLNTDPLFLPCYTLSGLI